MNIKQLHPNFVMPTLGSEGAGAYDLYMPEAGVLTQASEGTAIKLGFAAEVPRGFAALLLPRSGTGAKAGVSLNNTVGVIDSDYRGEWIANLRLRNEKPFAWNAGDRVLQMLIVPVALVNLQLVNELDATARGIGGFGSSGQ